MNKIIIRTTGGIGNQLFNYAAARRLAIKNNMKLKIDHKSGFKNDPYKRTYQLDKFNIKSHKATKRERMEPFSKIRRYIRRKFNKLRPFEKRNHMFQEFIEYDKRLLSIEAKRDIYFEGYWQSEKYFKDIESIIRVDLQIKPPTDNVNLEMEAQIKSSNAVAVHLRYFDQYNESSINNLSDDYYIRALKKMKKLIPDAHYFIFSDQPKTARTRLLFPDNHFTLVGHNKGDEKAYADLWLISQCMHFIISNSTFSWWGAWLSNHKLKHVIAPGYEKRYGSSSWGMYGLLPSEWITC